MTTIIRRLKKDATAWLTKPKTHVTSKDTSLTINVTRGDAASIHHSPLQKKAALLFFAALFIFVSLILAIVALVKSTSFVLEPFTNCLDDASLSNCPPDNPLPNTLYVYQPIILNNSYLVAPTLEGGLAFSQIVSPVLTVPLALFTDGSIVLNSINPLLAVPNTIVIAPITQPLITAEYTLSATYTFANPAQPTWQPTFSYACRTKNASHCGILLQAPDGPNIFRASSSPSVLIGNNIDDSLIAASQSLDVILNADLLITSVRNNGYAVPCIPNPATYISPTLFPNLYLEYYPVPGDSCTNYSQAVTAPIPTTTTCILVAALPSILALQGQYATVNISNTINIITYPTLCGIMPNVYTYTLGCSSQLRWFIKRLIQ